MSTCEMMNIGIGLTTIVRLFPVSLFTVHTSRDFAPNLPEPGLRIAGGPFENFAEEPRNGMDRPNGSEKKRRKSWSLKGGRHLR